METALTKAGEFAVTDFKSMEAIQAFADQIIKADISPYNKASDVVIVTLWAKEMNVPTMTALAHTMCVNSKIGMDSHLQRALLLSGGVTSQVVVTNGEIEDMRPLYSYASKGGFFTQDDIDRSPDKFEIVYDAEAIVVNVKNGNFNEKGTYTTAGKMVVMRSPEPVDYRTRVEFQRRYGARVVKEYGEFLWSNAVAAGLTTKSNWKAYPKACLYARAYTLGAARIADDLLMGTPTLAILADISDGSYEEPETEYTEVN